MVSAIGKEETLNNRINSRTQAGILKALANRNLDGHPAMTTRDVAARYGVNERTVTRILRSHHCDNYQGESDGTADQGE